MRSDAITRPSSRKIKILGALLAPVSKAGSLVQNPSNFPK